MYRNIIIEIENSRRNKMAKQIWKPSTLLNPVPVVLVTCADGKGNTNVFTVAWAGTVNSKPPMVSISVRKSRYSHEIIKKSREFVINLTNSKLVRATDYCGVKCGRDVDKFKEMNLELGEATKVLAPIIKSSPINLECKVDRIIELGSHDMFIAEVVACQIDDSLVDESGKLNLDKADLICYSHGEYWSLDKSLGYFGYSVTKKETLVRNIKNK